MGYVGGLALAMGVGAAVFGGAGLAHADESSGSHSAGAPQAQASTHSAAPGGSVGARSHKPAAFTVPTPRGLATATNSRAPAKRAATASGNVRSVVSSPRAGADDAPAAPTPVLLGALALIGREVERLCADHTASTAAFTAAAAYANAHPATTSAVPSAGDETRTPYGDIGKWMLQPHGQISNYGGQIYSGKTLLEPVNVIIVDPSSTTTAQAAQKLNAAMFWAGFPAQPIHSSGFQGRIDDVLYGQQPGVPLFGFSDSFFVFPNDHGRIFGPDPVETSSGYVWSGAFSTETLGVSNFLPAHIYVSSDMARTALAMRLILSGRATFVGMVPLDNAYNNATTTTGDHDGYAVALQLR
ncbi:hypothetical protein [Mycolicibacterium komossense]|uniref:hypothetical protein n=1 Tax=Mycolicibacterium komossense TaxID=1779 RepID=UPI0021F38EB3|nr:hypothetical protein [Mycolicibacterium komossense]